MKSIHSVVLPLITLFLCGCVPAYFARVPVLEGRVVDAQDKPVAAATVIVRSLEDPPKEIARLQTGADGRFFRADEGYWGVFIAGTDFIARAYRLHATSGDRTSAETEFSGAWVKPFGVGSSVQNFGDIPLR